MAQCLLYHGWLVLLKTGACCGLPIFFEVTTNWRAGCQKLACPVRREGRPESSSLPLSLHARKKASLTPRPYHFRIILDIVIGDGRLRNREGFSRSSATVGGQWNSANQTARGGLRGFTPKARSPERN